MNQKDFEQLLDRDPFIPLRVHMSDGNAFDVTRSHGVATAKTHIFVILPDHQWKWIPYRQIASVETLQAA